MIISILHYFVWIEVVLKQYKLLVIIFIYLFIFVWKGLQLPVIKVQDFSVLSKINFLIFSGLFVIVIYLVSLS